MCNVEERAKSEQTTINSVGVMRLMTHDCCAFSIIVLVKNQSDTKSKTQTSIPQLVNRWVFEARSSDSEKSMPQKFRTRDFYLNSEKNPARIIITVWVEADSNFHNFKG